MPAKYELDCLLPKLIKILGSEPEVGDGIRHHAENVSVESSASGHNRELRLAEKP